MENIDLQQIFNSFSTQKTRKSSPFIQTIDEWGPYNKSLLMIKVYALSLSRLPNERGIAKWGSEVKNFRVRMKLRKGVGGMDVNSKLKCSKMTQPITDVVSQHVIHCKMSQTFRPFIWRPRILKSDFSGFFRNPEICFKPQQKILWLGIKGK